VNIAYSDVVIDVACESPTQIIGFSEDITTIKSNSQGAIIVAVRGGCVRLFMKNNKNISEKSKLELLAKLGVSFLLDARSLRYGGIKNEDIEDFAYVKEAILNEIINLQNNDDYAYIYYHSHNNSIVNKVDDDKSEIKKEKRFKYNW